MKEQQEPCQQPIEEEPTRFAVCDAGGRRVADRPDVFSTICYEGGDARGHGSSMTFTKDRADDVIPSPVRIGGRAAVLGDGDLRGG